MATEYKQGKFSPKFPKKYRGDPTNIIYRSGWEKKVMENLDNNLNVISWASEEVIIPYISPIDNRPHRYYVDFFVEAKAPDGTIKCMLLEVKPHAQTLEPKTPKRRTRRFLTEVVTYGVNQAKWKAARDYCDLKGWEFKLITEKELFGKNNK
jgi:hypothetical protein